MFDLPDKLPVIAVAAGGKKAAELAATHGTKELKESLSRI